MGRDLIRLMLLSGQVHTKHKTQQLGCGMSLVSLLRKIRDKNGHPFTTSLVPFILTYGLMGGVKGQPWVWAGCLMCRELPFCVRLSTISSHPSHADNEALSTSLSSQLTTAGTNGILLTPLSRPSAIACFSLDSHTKARTG